MEYLYSERSNCRQQQTCSCCPERYNCGGHDHLSGGVILGAVTMADGLVFRCVPRHDTTKVRADGVDTVVLDFIFTRYREVGSVALEGTNESRHVASKTEQQQNRKIVVSSLSSQVVCIGKYTTG